jgi:hypothetical protein
LSVLFAVDSSRLLALLSLLSLLALWTGLHDEQEPFYRHKIRQKNQNGESS